jgi:hypothetical protein
MAIVIGDVPSPIGLHGRMREKQTESRKDALLVEAGDI